MTFTEARWRLLLIYELKTGWRISENNLAEEQRYTKLKEVTR